MRGRIRVPGGLGQPFWPVQVNWSSKEPRNPHFLTYIESRPPACSQEDMRSSATSNAPGPPVRCKVSRALRQERESGQETISCPGARLISVFTYPKRMVTPRVEDCLRRVMRIFLGMRIATFGTATTLAFATNPTPKTT